MKPCVFCAIVRGEAPASLVFDDERCVAFLDARPVFEGHLLLVPRKHVETLDDLDDDLVAPLFTTARSLSKALQRALPADGTFVAMNNRVSQSVAHLHIHVVPRKKKDGLRGFFWPRRQYASEEARNEMARRIHEALRA